MNGSFARELCKLAGVLALPKVTTRFNPNAAKSGIGMKTPAPATPSIVSGTFKAVGGKSAVTKSVPTASGSNLGTKVSMRSKTVPSAYGGTSQTSIR